MNCECSKENVELVYSFVHQALESLHQIVIDSGSMFDFDEAYSGFSGSLLRSSIVQISFQNAYKQFEVGCCFF